MDFANSNQHQHFLVHIWNSHKLWSPVNNCTTYDLHCIHHRSMLMLIHQKYKFPCSQLIYGHIWTMQNQLRIPHCTEDWSRKISKLFQLKSTHPMTDMTLNLPHRGYEFQMASSIDDTQNSYSLVTQSSFGCMDFNWNSEVWNDPRQHNQSEKLTKQDIYLFKEALYITGSPLQCIRHCPFVQRTITR